MPPEAQRPPLPQKQEVLISHKTLSKAKTSTPNLLSGTQAQILKERNYVYKKESCERSQGGIRSSVGTGSKLKGNVGQVGKGKSKERVETNYGIGKRE